MVVDDEHGAVSPAQGEHFAAPADDLFGRGFFHPELYPPSSALQESLGRSHVAVRYELEAAARGCPFAPEHAVIAQRVLRVDRTVFDVPESAQRSRTVESGRSATGYVRGRYATQCNDLSGMSPKAFGCGVDVDPAAVALFRNRVEERTEKHVVEPFRAPQRFRPVVARDAAPQFPLRELPGVGFAQVHAA